MLILFFIPIGMTCLIWLVVLIAHTVVLKVGFEIDPESRLPGLVSHLPSEVAQAIAAVETDLRELGFSKRADATQEGLCSGQSFAHSFWVNESHGEMASISCTLSGGIVVSHRLSLETQFNSLLVCTTNSALAHGIANPFERLFSLPDARAAALLAVHRGRVEHYAPKTELPILPAAGEELQSILDGRGRTAAFLSGTNAVFWDAERKSFRLTPSGAFRVAWAQQGPGALMRWLFSKRFMRNELRKIGYRAFPVRVNEPTVP
jgi:hypothetical protein